MLHRATRRRRGSAWGFLLTPSRHHGDRRPDPDHHALHPARAAARRPRDVRLRDAAEEARCSRQGLLQQARTRGPFKVTSLSAQSASCSARNDNVLVGTKPKIKNVKVQIVTDDNARLLLLQGGASRRHREPAGQPDRPDRRPTRTSSVDLFPSTRVDFIRSADEHSRLQGRERAPGDELRDRPRPDEHPRVPGHATVGTTVLAVQDAVLGQSVPEPVAVDLAKAKASDAESKYPNGFTSL